MLDFLGIALAVLASGHSLPGLSGKIEVSTRHYILFCLLNALPEIPIYLVLAALDASSVSSVTCLASGPLHLDLGFRVSRAWEWRVIPAAFSWLGHLVHKIL